MPSNDPVGFLEVLHVWAPNYAHWSRLEVLGAFCLVFFPSLAMDIITNRGRHAQPSVRSALTWTAVWMIVGVAFAGVIWQLMGAHWASLYLTGYAMEKALAVDNLFAFMAVFGSFALTNARAKHQHRILHWGIVGAIAIRAILLMGIGYLVTAKGGFEVEWSTLLILGATGVVGSIALRYLATRAKLEHPLIVWGLALCAVMAMVASAYAGFKLCTGASGGFEASWHMIIMLILAGAVVIMAIVMTIDAFSEGGEDEVDYSRHWSVLITRRILPVSESVESGKFFVRLAGTLAVTPLFLCLVCIEMVDVGFAFDSMPAIAAVAKDGVVMFTGTMMAVAGLRNLYFALDAMKRHLCHLDKAVALLLWYVAFKVALDAIEVVHISMGMNMAIIGLVLGGGILVSIIFPDESTHDQDGSATPSIEHEQSIEATLSA